MIGIIFFEFPFIRKTDIQPPFVASICVLVKFASLHNENA